MRNAIIENIEKKLYKKRPPFSVGDRITVHVRLKEGDKERSQAFRGVVISKQPKSGKGTGATFTVRKISEGVGVERIFPLHSPHIDKIDVDVPGDVRRSRLYYLRSLQGKKARLKEGERFADMVVGGTAPTEAAAAGTEITSSAQVASELAPKAAPPPETKAPREPKPTKK